MSTTNGVSEIEHVDLDMESLKGGLKEHMTVEEAIDKVVTKVNMKLVLLFAFAGLMGMSNATTSLATVFTGKWSLSFQFTQLTGIKTLLAFTFSNPTVIFGPEFCRQFFWVITRVK